MMDEDAIESNLPELEDEILFYGRPDYKRIMPLVLKIMPDIPRDFLVGFIPDKSYQTFHAWQTGKRTPRNPEGLIEAVVAWARQDVEDPQDSGAQEALKRYLAYKAELSRRVLSAVREIPDSVLHHRMNLNARTIARLRKGQDLPMATIRRLASLLSSEG